MKKLTIIMVAYKHFEETKKTLENLIANTDPSDYKIIFFDNCMEPKEESEVHWMFRNAGVEFRYQGSTYNRGWIDCINTGYMLADTEFVLTVHNDVIFPKYWLHNMMRRFSDPEVAAVGPVISYAMGPQSEVLAYQYFGCEPKYLLGLFFMCRRDVLESIKVSEEYLATAYGMGDKEELELCHRIRKLGFRFKIAYDVKVKHTGEKGFVDLLGSADAFHEYQNKQLDILRMRLGDPAVDEIFTIDMKNPVRIMFGLLTRDTHIHYKFHFSMLGLWGKLFQSGIAKYISSFHIGRGHPTDRNVIIKDAIEKKFTHVCFIDDDMVFPDDAVIKLLEHDVDICTGTAFQRGKPHAPCMFFVSPEKEVYPVPVINHGMKEIDACGGYFMLINLASIVGMEEPYFKWGDKDLGYCMESGGIGEDIYFGLKAKLAGAEIWCDSDIDITHIGDERMINVAYYERYRDSGELEKDLEALKLKCRYVQMKL